MKKISPLEWGCGSQGLNLKVMKDSRIKSMIQFIELNKVNKYGFSLNKDKYETKKPALTVDSEHKTKTLNNESSLFTQMRGSAPINKKRFHTICYSSPIGRLWKVGQSATPFKIYKIYSPSL